jgi:hypothetical protein
MLLPVKRIHPLDESKNLVKAGELNQVEVDTFDGKLHMEWDPTASVTPIGQLPFFIQYLKLGHRFLPWVEDCPLEYESNNAPYKMDVLGSLLLSVLSGHTRYAHITTLACDQVNPQLLGMKKVVSDDSARRALLKIEEERGVQWLQTHLQSCFEPLLQTPWILDTDVTVKCLYGKQQEGAEIGYNPKKPGRPSHTYHSYLIANLRLVLEVEVQAGNLSKSKHSMPGLLALLERLPANGKPQFIRGDCDWGTEPVMSALETKNYRYLFKLKKSKHVKQLIKKHHSCGQWEYFNDDLEIREDYLQLMNWKDKRRVVIVRRKLKTNRLVAIEYDAPTQTKLSFIDDAEEMKVFEYAVLVTNLEDEVISILQHYRDRADCENYFDEIKNQWGWGGYTTRNLKSCRFMARIIALIYNWWTLFVRLANPGNHLEAITSRPLLLSSVGRLVQSGRQKKMIITSRHAQGNKVKKIFQGLSHFFSQLKSIAPQLTPKECWEHILVRAMAAFKIVTGSDPPLLALTG